MLTACANSWLGIFTVDYHCFRPEGYDLDLDICDDVVEEEESYIDLNDEIFGMDHNKMKYFNDGRHSLVFKTEVLAKASKNYDELTAGAVPLTQDGGVKKLVSQHKLMFLCYFVRI